MRMREFLKGMKTKKSAYDGYGDPYFSDDDDLYNPEEGTSFHVTDGVFCTGKYEELLGVPSGNFFLVNADAGYEFHLPNQEIQSIGFSFECMAQFYKNFTYKDVANSFAAKRFVVVDATPDSCITHSFKKKSDESLVQFRNRIADQTPVGYTAMVSYFHRSGSVLVKDLDNKCYIIFGQDEGSYFGSELPSDFNGSTVDDAFLALMPKEAVNKKFVRQGEWFFVETKKPDLLDIKLTVIPYLDGQESNTYPFMDSEDSAKHFITYDGLYVLNNGDLVFEDPTMGHERGDHADVVLKGFYSLHRNTAVQSYSQEGVD